MNSESPQFDARRTLNKRQKEEPKPLPPPKGPEQKPPPLRPRRDDGVETPVAPKNRPGAPGTEKVPELEEV